MVGLPLVIGSKSIASRYVSPAQPIEVFDSDDVRNDGPSILVPSALLPNTSIPAASTDSPDGIATIVTARSSDQELLAVITIYYYHMLRQAPHSTEEQEVAYSVAELHIQISSMGQSTSLRGRDSMHRIPLRPFTASVSSSSNQQSSYGSTAVFSWDRRFLSCLRSLSVGRCCCLLLL